MIINKIRKQKEKTSPLYIALAIILALYSALLIFIFVWAILTSFKDPLSFRDNIIGLPEKWQFGNYKEMFSIFKVRYTAEDGNIYYFTMEYLYMNGIIYAAGCALVSLVAQALIGYAIANFDYAFSKVLYAIVIATMAIPIVGSDASMLVMLKDLNIYNTWFSMFLLKAGFLGIYTLVLANAFKAIPKSFSEAAQIDGASNFTVMFRVIFPCVKNIFGIIFLLYFIQFWNDYQTPNLYLTAHPTIAYGVYFFNFQTYGKTSAVPYKLCGTMFLFVPSITVFILFNKKIMSGNLTVGGVKE